MLDEKALSIAMQRYKEALPKVMRTKAFRIGVEAYLEHANKHSMVKNQHLNSVMESMLANPLPDEVVYLTELPSQNTLPPSLRPDHTTAGYGEQLACKEE